MDQDIWTKVLHYHGLPLLKAMIGDNVDPKDEKAELFQMLKNKGHLIFKDIKDDTVTPTKKANPYPIPIEMFQNISPIEKRDIYFKHLERGDILNLRVVNIDLPDNYKLLVLSKHNCCMKLDDLSLVMYLPKLKPELDIAGTELSNGDLLRAAFWSCNIDERKLFVTLDNSFLDDEEAVRLGKIDACDLPNYVEGIENYRSFVDYLHAHPNRNWEKQMYQTLGLKEGRHYSLHEEWDGKTYPATEYGVHIKKKYVSMQSNTHLKKALRYNENGNHVKAFMHLNTALAVFPDNIDALVSRGSLFANQDNLRNAFNDIEKALNLNPNCEPARKQMSVILVATSKVHVKQNDIAKALEALETAMQLDKDNNEAIEAQKELLEATTIHSNGSESEVSAVSKSSSTKSKKSKKKQKKHRDRKSNHDRYRHTSKSSSSSSKHRS